MILIVPAVYPPRDCSECRRTYKPTNYNQRTCGDRCSEARQRRIELARIRAKRREKR